MTDCNCDWLYEQELKDYAGELNRYPYPCPQCGSTHMQGPWSYQLRHGFVYFCETCFWQKFEPFRIDRLGFRLNNTDGF